MQALGPPKTLGLERLTPSPSHRRRLNVCGGCVLYLGRALAIQNSDDPWASERSSPEKSGPGTVGGSKVKSGSI